MDPAIIVTIAAWVAIALLAWFCMYSDHWLGVTWWSYPTIPAIYLIARFLLGLDWRYALGWTVITMLAFFLADRRWIQNEWKRSPWGWFSTCFAIGIIIGIIYYLYGIPFTVVVALLFFDLSRVWAYWVGGRMWSYLAIVLITVLLLFVIRRTWSYVLGGILTLWLLNELLAWFLDWRGGKMPLKHLETLTKEVMSAGYHRARMRFWGPGRTSSVDAVKLIPKEPPTRFIVRLDTTHCTAREFHAAQEVLTREKARDVSIETDSTGEPRYLIVECDKDYKKGAKVVRLILTEAFGLQEDEEYHTSFVGGINGKPDPMVGWTEPRRPY